MFKKLFVLLLVLSSVIMLSSCQEKEQYDIVTTLFPQYDMARAIAGDELTVHNILPFGTSPHGFEITSKDRQIIESSSLFIYTSDELELWATELSLNDTTILNLEIESEAEHDHDHEDEDEHEDDHEHEDVHYWTNPDTMRHMVHVILDHIIEIKPELETVFTSRAESYLDQLTAYDQSLLSFLTLYEDVDLELYIAGHNAMAEFGEHYGIEIISLFPDFIPDAELSSLELTTFTQELIEKGIQAFFIEPVFDVEPLAANTIVNEFSSRNLTISFYELHQFHNISATDFENQLTLFDLFENNIENIKTVVELNYGTR